MKLPTPKDLVFQMQALQIWRTKGDKIGNNAVEMSIFT